MQDIYKCDGCGFVAELVHSGACVPECCGKPLNHLLENTVDAAKEKHVPVVEKQDGGYLVKVGSVAHPMDEKHYIRLIELFTADGVCHCKVLEPGEAPEVFFAVGAPALYAREYCTLHGLWANK